MEAVRHLRWVASRSPRSYRVPNRSLESWTPPQERRGLCQARDTRMWLNAQQVEDETSSVFARKHTPVWKDGPSIVQGCYWGPSGGGV